MNATALPPSSIKKWWVLIGTGIMIVLINIDTTIVNLALATIAKSLKVTLEQAQWIINSYALSIVIFFVVGGKLSQLHGKRNIFLLGTTLFFIGSLLCGTTHSYDILVTARFIQGIGFAFTLSLALVMTSDSFPDSQKGLALGICATLTGLGQALGPTTGGVILHFFTWHWIFLVNIPLCIVSFALTYWAYPRDNPTEHGKPLDKLGILSLAIGITAILMANNNLHSWGINSAKYQLLLYFGMIVILAFYFLELRAKSPLINFDLFHNRNYLLTNLVRSIYMYGWAMILFLLPLYLQNILFFNSLKAGAWLLIMSILLGVASPISGRLCDSIGFKPTLLMSMFCSALSFLLLAIINLDHASWLLVTALLIFGLGTGLHVPSSIQGVVVSSNQTHRGSAMGIFFTIAFLGATFGVALSGAEISWLSNTHFTQLLQQHHIQLSQQQRQTLSQVVNGTYNIHQFEHLLPWQLFTNISTLASMSFIYGFKLVLLINVALAFVGACLSFPIAKKS